ncbi:MAG: hypothetical protein AB7F41_05390 [Methylocystis sp.]|uniref:VHL beta domain-containing protein n=1 Tax=Methylocystis sp. TaxID=1911079 RepID=UPI003D09DB72
MTNHRNRSSYLLRVACAAAASVGAASLADAGCPKARSQNSDVATTITFVNQSGEYRGIYWKDFSGGDKSYGGLNPGESKTINTFLTHPWEITNGPGDCLQVVFPRRGGSTVRLTAPRKRERRPPHGE